MSSRQCLFENDEDDNEIFTSTQVAHPRDLFRYLQPRQQTVQSKIVYYNVCLAPYFTYLSIAFLSIRRFKELKKMAHQYMSGIVVIHYGYLTGRVYISPSSPQKRHSSRNKHLCLTRNSRHVLVWYADPTRRKQAIMPKRALVFNYPEPRQFRECNHCTTHTIVSEIVITRSAKSCQLYISLEGTICYFSNTFLFNYSHNKVNTTTQRHTNYEILEVRTLQTPEYQENIT